MRLAACCLVCLLGAPASAHDFWSNGEPVPAGVKSACCGPADAHHLNPTAVHLKPDGWHIDGLDVVIPVERALPSPDGTYWAFWNVQGEPTPVIYCFFVPQGA